MRLSVIKHEDNEKVFFNPGIFQEGEDLIVFSFKEFDKFYNETVHSLNVVKSMIKDSLNSPTATNLHKDLKYIEDWINLIQDDMDLLIKFDTQTTLNSFNNINVRKMRPKNRIKKINNVQIQCLMGL